MKKSIILSAIAALGFGTSAMASPAIDLFPVGVGKKKQVSRKRRMRNMTVELKQLPKREHKDRHKKGRP